jgi:copper chaperone CopZ
MTCEHCAAAVREEIGALAGVGAVEVELHPDSASTVRVSSEQPLATEQVVAALDEAGDYRLAP